MARIRSVHDIHSETSIEELEVPEWGGEIGVRGLTVSELEGWQRSLMTQPKNEKPHVTLERIRNSNARLVVLGACDLDPASYGDPIFTNDDIPQLSSQNNRGMAKVADAIQRLTGIGDYAESAVAMAKNSVTGQDSDSPTG
jgi:hypothetical protein